MKAFLILEDGHVFTGTSIGSAREVISEIVFNTSMTGYLEVMTDPSYAGQAVCMTYPLIGNYGICYDDQESRKPWIDGFIVRELSRVPSNFRSVDTIQHFLSKNDIPGIAGIDTRALTKILREKGTMNGMITVDENYDLDTIIPRLKAYTTGKVVEKVSCREKEVLKGNGPKVALLDLGAKKNIARSLNERGCQVTIYPALTSAEEILGDNPDGIMLSNGPGDPKECTSIIKEIKKLYDSDVPIFAICLGHQLMALATGIGTALFVVLTTVQIPLGVIPNTALQPRAALLAFFAAVFGPVVGGIMGLLGHAFGDALFYGSVWWSWVFPDAVFGILVGLFAAKYAIKDGGFEKKQIVLFNVVQVVANLAAWVIVAPVLDIVIYAEPANKVFAQGAWACLGNVIIIGILGTLIAAGYSKIGAKSSSLSKED